jgi:protein-disulfide isomerase
MPTLRLDTAALATLALTLALLAPAAIAPAMGQDQAHIDAAIKAYEAKQQADTEKAHDQLVINHADQVLNDPASPVEGNPNGKFVIVEFFDYTCPYCKATEPRMEQFLKTNHDAKLIIKEFPILTPQSMVATKTALALKMQGKYAPFHDALMTMTGPLTQDVITEAAKKTGADMARLKRDMQSPAITDAIIANFNLARGLRIFQTPGYIFNGHIYTGQSADIDFNKLYAAANHK